MRRPFFSVVIPTLNEEHALPHLLLDLENQTYKNFEVIIVDGGSHDKTLDFVRATRRRDERFTLQKSRRKNVSIQRNLGTTKASGHWILFLDADSRIESRFLHTLRTRVTQGRLDGFTCYATPDSTALDAIAYVQLQNILLEMMANIGTPYSVGACMGVRKTVLETVGGFDSTIHHMEDSELAKRIHENGHRFSVLRSPTYTYSLRRQRKEGKLKMISKLFPYYIKSLVSNDFSTPAKLYPMKGGGTFKKNIE